jgi:hypothetical protein
MSTFMKLQFKVAKVAGIGLAIVLSVLSASAAPPSGYAWDTNQLTGGRMLAGDGPSKAGCRSALRPESVSGITSAATGF